MSVDVGAIGPYGSAIAGGVASGAEAQQMAAAGEQAEAAGVVLQAEGQHGAKAERRSSRSGAKKRALAPEGFDTAPVAAYPQQSTEGPLIHTQLLSITGSGYIQYHVMDPSRSYYPALRSSTDGAAIEVDACEYPRLAVLIGGG